LAVNGLDVYHWLNNEFGRLNFFWCGLRGRACFKIVFCWGWLFEARLLDWSWDSGVIVILRVLSLDDSWLFLVLSGVGRRAAIGAAAGGGAAVVVLVTRELVVNLLLQVVKSSAMLLLVLVLLLRIIHLLGGAGLSGVCLVFFALVLGNWDNVVLGDMLLSGFNDRVVLLSRRVGRRENRKRDRNSSVKVQIEGLQREGAPDRELPSNYLEFWLREKCCNRDIHVTTEKRRWGRGLLKVVVMAANAGFCEG
jgi:hypothetical protein